MNKKELINKLESENILIWLDNQRIKTEDGKDIDFYNHRYLWDIYNDWSPKIVCLKAAQICFTITAIIKAIYAAKHKKLNIIYTLPSEGDINDIVSSKVNNIINNNPILQEWIKDKDSIQQKRVGDRTMYFRGTKTERAALAVSSDLNIHDEEDRSDQQVIAQYSSRLQHSDYKWEWHFSNPSVKGNGVDRYWEVSDQKHWFIKCPHCGAWQYLSWPDSIDMEKEIYICKECGKELSDDVRRKGVWVQKYKNREWSGYWISLLMAPWVSAKEIINYYKTKPQGYFYNFVLGLPEPSSTISQVDPDMIYKNCFQFVNSQTRPVIGVDIGTTIHYVIGNKEGLFYYNKTKQFDDLEKLLLRFKDAIMVIDAGPDIFRVRDLREKFMGRVFLCHFTKDRKTMQLIRWGKDQEFGNVLADRNRMIQIVVDEFNDGRITLQGTRDDWKEYYQHWSTMYRTTEIDKLGTPVYEWLSTTGNDHWCLATTYWRIGMDKFSEMGEVFQNVQKSSIKIVPTVDLTGKIENPALIKQILKPKNDWRKC